MHVMACVPSICNVQRRCSVQLTILGYVLVPIFSYDRWWLVLIYAGFMITIAAAEAVSRPLGSYKVNVPSSHVGAYCVWLICMPNQHPRTSGGNGEVYLEKTGPHVQVFFSSLLCHNYHILLLLLYFIEQLQRAHRQVALMSVL